MTATTAARTAISREPGLFAVGLAGWLLATVCLVAVGIHGRHLEPEGKLLDAATFCFGVGLYVLTVAMLLPVAGFSDTARRRWRRAFYVFPVYGFVIEPLQSFRGIDPRFTDEGEPIDGIAGALFGVTAVLTTVLFLLLAVQFFRRGVLADRPVLLLGVRYGVVSVVFSFGVGVIMSVNRGRELGDDGDLILAHAIGVHGLQTMPILALAVMASTLSQPGRRVHVAGAAWLTACIGALLQALFDEAPMEPAPLSVLTLVALVTWSVTTATALVSSVQSARLRTT